MKVVHLITRLDPGGSAENTLLTAHYLAEKGWDATLASGPGWTDDDAKVGGMEVPVFLVPNLCRDPSPVNDVRAFWQIWRLLRRERPTILHTHSAKAGILGRWAGLLARVPVIVHTPHGHVLYGYAKGLKNWIYLAAERATAPVTDCLVALSEGERRESAAAGIGDLEQWVVVPSGVDVAGLEPRVPPSVTDRPLRIGVVARLEHVKGLDIVVRAAAYLGAADVPPFEVLVWGDGRQYEDLVELARRLDAAETVRFVGTTEPVEAFLGGLDLYVQPSRNEGMGRALVMAQGIGLPIVASRVCGIPDVVLDGETGFLVETERPRRLADALARLLRDAEVRNDFGAAARSWIMTNDETGFPRFSLEAMLWRLERLYEGLSGAEAAD